MTARPRERSGVLGFIPDDIDAIRDSLHEALRSLEDGQLRRPYGPERAARDIAEALLRVLPHCDIHDRRLRPLRDKLPAAVERTTTNHLGT